MPDTPDDDKRGPRGQRGATGARGAEGRRGQRGLPGAPADISEAYARLEGKANELSAALAGVRAELKAQNRTSDKQARIIKRLRVVTGLAVVAAILGGYGWWENREAVRAIVATRTEARHTQCRRDNEIRRDAVNASRKKATDLIDTSDREKARRGEPLTSPQLRAAFIMSQGEVTAESYPHRDCSKTGIDAYYQHPPAADPEPCEPDRKGLCR